MVNIQTNYLGLTLQSPVIVGSSGLSSRIENLQEFEKEGAGAIVLKSLFEEQIRHEIAHQTHRDHTLSQYPEAADYIANYSRDEQVTKYLEYIRIASRTVGIPIIASINCISTDEWITYAKQIEEAGADALELNIFVMPSDPMMNGLQNEKRYFDIIQEVIKHVTIPVAVKISYYFSALAKTAIEMSWTGIKGIVMFNRFYSPDFNIDSMRVISSHTFSSPDEIAISLRWVAILSKRLHCDVCASTGVHDSEGLIKQLLAGAKAVQIVSTLYKNGFHRIGEMNSGLQQWMLKHEFETLDSFIGKLSLKEKHNPASFERVQFMKHVSGIE